MPKTSQLTPAASILSTERVVATLAGGSTVGVLASGLPVSTAQAQADAVVQANLDAHEADVANPHAVTKTQVGLGNVDNTSDANKPVSTAQQAALDLKATVVALTAETAARVAADAQSLAPVFRRLNSIRAGTNTQLRVLALGDSLGWFKPQYLVPELAAAYGQAGQTDNYPPTLAGGAAAGTSDFTIWPTGVNWTLPSAGTITFNGGSTNSHYVDTIKLFYLVEPGAGTFKLQTSSAGGAFADEASYTSVDAAGVRALGVITLTKTLGPWRVQAVGLSGTVKILGAFHIALGKPGVCAFRLDVGGAPLSSINAMDAGMFSSLLTELAPDLICFEMRDVDDAAQAAAWPAQLIAMQARFDAVVPNASWIFSGAPPMQDAGKDTLTVIQNQELRAHAATRGGYFFDGYGTLVSWANVSALGWGNDGSHLSDACQKFIANRLKTQSGLFADSPMGPQSAIFGTSVPNSSKIRQQLASSQPAFTFQTAAGTGQYYSSQIRGNPAAANRGLEVYTSPIAYDGAEVWGKGFSVVDATNYGGAGTSHVVVGAQAANGVSILQLPSTGTTALANGISWGSGKTIHFQSALSDAVVTGLDLVIATVGKTLQIKEGANACAGVATMVGGEVVVSTTAVTANSRIKLTVQSLGTVTRPAAVGVTARTAATSFTVQSSDVTDTSIVYWEIMEPAP